MTVPTRTSFLLSTVALLAACGGGGGGSSAAVPRLSFSAPQLATTGGTSGRSLLVADVDHDGFADVLVANESFASVSLLRGRADGTLTNGTLLPAPALVASIAAGDLDGDRVIDLVSASGATGDAKIALGSGSGAFGAATSLVLPWAVREIRLADWNGDGHLDLVLSSALTAEVGVMLGDGAGGFGLATAIAVGVAPAAIAIADVDGDERPDLVVVGNGSARVDVLRNDGSGGFLPAVVSAAPSLGGKLAVCDVDGDRVVDVVAFDALRTGVVVGHGAGTGTFTFPSPSVVLSSTSANGFALGDLDGDGHVDVVATAGNRVLAAYGDGAGGFRSLQALHVDGLGASWVAAADLVGDGTPDVLYVSGSERVGVLRNPRARPTGLANYGGGTSDCRGRIGMWANGSPRIGNAAYGYLTTNAPADAAGVLLQGGPPDIAGSDLLGIGALIHVTFGAISTRLVFSDHLGACFMPEPVPSAAGLVGLPVYVQTLWQVDPAHTCTTSTAGFVSSVGLTSTVQP